MKKTTTTYRTFRDALSQFLTPQVWKQAHQVWRPEYSPPRWSLQPLVWVVLGMTWVCGDSQEECFASARAAFVACHQHERRPGTSLAGFLMALVKLPMPVLRALAGGVRERIGEHFVEEARINGWVPFACDGSRLECPRSEQLQQRLGKAGKTDSAPMVYLTALVLLPCGLLWSWRLGKGTASEQDHMRHLLPTLPERSLLVADALFMGYDLFTAIMRTPADYLIRLSSRVYLYTLEETLLDKFREGLVYYWPQEARKQGLPPIKARLLRVGGAKADVWLLTSVLDRSQLSQRTAKQVYRWRWKNEGLFRIYKCQLGKMKLHSRTVATVHREAEGSLLALQLLLAMTAEAVTRGSKTVVIVDSARRMLLRLRGVVIGLLRTLGPRQFATYQRMLERVRDEARERVTPKIRQDWPRRKKHKPPKPPKIRVMSDDLKAQMERHFEAA